MWEVDIWRVLILFSCWTCCVGPEHGGKLCSFRMVAARPLASSPVLPRRQSLLTPGPVDGA